MATLLVNAKMHPDLAARVAASVSGRRRNRPSAHRFARAVAWFRIGAIFAVVALVGAVVLTRHRVRTEQDQNRAALLQSWQHHTESLQPDDFAFLGRIERLLAVFAGQYTGDTVAEELRPAGAFAAMLGRPSTYVRGPIAAFSNGTGIAKAAAESGKDALLLCLRDPPASRTEKQLLPKARLALAGGNAAQELTPNIRRLHELELGLLYLQPQWGERIRTAQDPSTLMRLERELNRAPLEAAKAVLRSNLLIAVLDEPNEGGGVTELDGEHAHSMRLVVAELPGGKVLLMQRRRVDPEWITPNRRSQYARELDGCRFALEVHEAVQAPSQAETSRK